MGILSLVIALSQIHPLSFSYLEFKPTSLWTSSQSLERDPGLKHVLLGHGRQTCF